MVTGASPPELDVGQVVNSKHFVSGGIHGIDQLIEPIASLEAASMKTILLVDDESALIETLTELLEGAGYRVLSAANGHDGLALLQEERPDLVLADLTMPFVDGRELVRRMRALPDFQSTPIVIMSATTDASARSDLLGTIDASAFVGKPFRWERVLKTIVRLIGKEQAG